LFAGPVDVIASSCNPPPEAINWNSIRNIGEFAERVGQRRTIPWPARQRS
jgi:hypothetical protein